MRAALILLVVFAGTASGAEKSIKELKRDLRRALAAADDKAAARTIAALRRLGGEEAVSVLTSTASRLRRENNETYWLLVDGIASFGDSEALGAIGDFIVDHPKSLLASDVLFALERNTLSTKFKALVPIMNRGPGKFALQAVRQLSRLPVPEVVDALIARLEKTKPKEKELRRYLAGALTELTGKNFGADARLWKMWWAGNRDQPLGRGRRSTGRTGTVLDHVDEIRRERIVGLEKLPARRIVVIKGKCVDWKRFDHNFDHIENLLERMQLPHTVITKEDFEAGYRLDRSMVVCINCMMWREHCVCPHCKPGHYTGNRLHRCTGCNKHDIRTYKFSGAACKRLKKFVESGGFLFTEDWVLEELLERIYPDLIVSGPKLPEADVPAVPGPGEATHPYLEGVFHHDRKTLVVRRKGHAGKTGVFQPAENVRKYFTRSKHRWKIDLDSPAIVVKNKRKVHVLLASPKLARTAEGNAATSENRRARTASTEYRISFSTS